ncbi:MAG: hypothetical protein RKE49_09605 [Oceanicaulis sp.]
MSDFYATLNALRGPGFEALFGVEYHELERSDFSAWTGNAQSACRRAGLNNLDSRIVGSNAYDALRGGGFSTSRSSTIVWLAALDTLELLAAGEPPVRSASAIESRLALFRPRLPNDESANLAASLAAARAAEADAAYVSQLNRLLAKPGGNLEDAAALARFASMERTRRGVSAQVLADGRRRAAAQIQNDFPAIYADRRTRFATLNAASMQAVFDQLEAIEPFLSDDTNTLWRSEVVEYLRLARAAEAERARLARAEYLRSPQGRLETAEAHRGDVYANIVPRIIGSRYRLFAAGDNEALELALRRDVGLVDQVMSNPVGGLIDELLPGFSDAIKQQALDSRYAGLISAYIMVRSDRLGLCGDPASVFNASSQTVTRYVNGFGHYRGTRYGPRREWSFAVPREFAAIVRRADNVDVNWAIEPGLRRLVDSFGGCNSDTRRRIERNMLDFYYARER